MPPARRCKSSSSPAEPHFQQHTYASTFALSTAPSSAPILQLNSRSISPVSLETESSPSPPVTKKRSHGKSRPPGHVPRPPNAFIIFRTDYIRSMSTHSTPEMSKNLGALWKSMTKAEKQPWNDKAHKVKEEHQKQNPGYKYRPIHRRDEKGNCIRKPRKPNKPRVKDTPCDMLDDLPTSFSWMEGKNGGGEFPNTSLPSDDSYASPPPRSPSPAASLYIPEYQSSHQALRRSSSVPLPGSDDRFFFGMPPAGSVYPPSPTGRYVSRRVSKRPSTSMDFACAGVIPPELYNNNDPLLSPGDASQRRPRHRRSISAPAFRGEIPSPQFVYATNHSFAQEANPLTPINPVFGSVFDKFSWNTTSSSQSASAGYSNDMMPQHPYATLDIPIPPTTSSPTSNCSRTTTSTPSQSSPPLSDPAMQHPAPTSHFDFQEFQAQIRAFDAPDFERIPNGHAPFGNMGQEIFDNVLGLILPPSYASQQTQVYPMDEPQASEQQHYRVDTMHPGNAIHLYSEDLQAPSANVLSADLHGYEEGRDYTQPQMDLPQALDFNELIVDGY